MPDKPEALDKAQKTANNMVGHSQGGVYHEKVSANITGFIYSYSYGFGYGLRCPDRLAAAGETGVGVMYFNRGDRTV